MFGSTTSFAAETPGTRRSNRSSRPATSSSCSFRATRWRPNSLDTEIAIIKERQKNREEVHCYPLLLTTTPSYALDPVRDWNIRPPNLRPFGSYPPDERDQHMLDAAEILRARKLQTFQ